jgi:hypothetical protein
MKRQILSIATVLALTAAGATFAQSTINTTAPGPTQQREPGQTNNNLPNPGNPQTDLQNNRGTVQENGTVEGTASESINNTNGQTTGTTGSTGSTTGTMGTGSTGSTGTTGTMGETETGSGVDVDVDTGNRAQGAVDVDVTRTTDSDTDASGSGVQSNGQYSGSDTNTSLPSTASDLPTVALFGMLALFGAFAIRTYAKRNA